MIVTIDQAYRNLALTIVTNAVTDYKSCMAKARYQLKTTGAISPALKDEIRDLEEFFDSDWCELLCNLDGSAIKKHLRKNTRYYTFVGRGNPCSARD